MRNLDEISVIVKTFLRPECLDNILESIKVYCDVWNVKFADVIVIDDSTDEIRTENQQIVENYNKDFKISYYGYSYNALGLSKGRNEALKKTSTAYFLLCDDDMILDEKCDIGICLQLLKDKQIDILSGYYRNIDNKHDSKYVSKNWMGFISIGQEYDVCTIYSDLFPEYMECDIAQNFFLGKTDIVKEVSFPEYLPINEHNIFFRNCKIAGAKVASTSRLYAKHLHLRARETGYERLRQPIERKIVGPKVKGVVVWGEREVFTFSNYMYVNDSTYLKDSRFVVRIDFESMIRKIYKIVRKVKYYLLRFIHGYRGKVKRILMQYPQVMNSNETLTYILENKVSLSRFGDGELKLALGQGLGEKGEPNEYQVRDERLREKLVEILKMPHEKCLVAIDRCIEPLNDEILLDEGLTYWEKFWIGNWRQLKKMYNYNYVYGCTAVSRIPGFHENSIYEYRKLWEDRKIVFVIGDNSHWVDEMRLFDNVREKKYIVVKGRSSFTEYDKIVSEIKKCGPDWLYLVALGPTATCLAYDLSIEGFQLLDIGHLVNCFLEYIGERKRPEVEHHLNRQFYCENINEKESEVIKISC